jgi:hypothetical protein
LTILEIAGIYQRAIFLDFENREGNLDDPISKFTPFVEELVQKLV